MVVATHASVLIILAMAWGARSGAVRITPNVTYGEGLIDCPNGVRNDPEKSCKTFKLLLDIYEPSEAASSPRPAIVLAHGGGNTGGVKEQNCFEGTARYFAGEHGFVAFNIDYRLSGQHGTFPNSSSLFRSARS